MSPRTQAPMIQFAAKLSTIDTSSSMRLPERASRDLPSRGQVAVRGTINGHEFETVVEPDGSFGQRRPTACGSCASVVQWVDITVR